MRGASTLRQSSGKAWRSHVSQALPEGDGHDHDGQCAKAAYRPGRELLQQDALIREHVLGLSCEQRDSGWTGSRKRFRQPEWRRVSVQSRYLPPLLIRDQLSQPRHRRNSDQDRSLPCRRRSNSRHPVDRSSNLDAFAIASIAAFAPPRAVSRVWAAIAARIPC